MRLEVAETIGKSKLSWSKVKENQVDLLEKSEYDYEYDYKAFLLAILTCPYTLHISSYFLLNPIPTRLGVGKSPLLIIHKHDPQNKHKIPY